jgi:ribosomal protein S18 acetylase RimI-like enzyme
MEVRRATHADVDAVLELWAAARSAAASTPDDAAAVERLLADGDGALLVAEADGRVVGALVAGWDGWRGNMYRLAVHPDYRRRGIGRKLLDVGEAHLRSLGGRRVTALVAYDDTVAAGFWDAVGYPVDPDIGRRVRNL